MAENSEFEPVIPEPFTGSEPEAPFSGLSLFDAKADGGKLLKLKRNPDLADNFLATGVQVPDIGEVAMSLWWEPKQEPENDVDSVAILDGKSTPDIVKASSLVEKLMNMNINITSNMPFATTRVIMHDPLSGRKYATFISVEDEYLNNGKKEFWGREDEWEFVHGDEEELVEIYVPQDPARLESLQFAFYRVDPSIEEARSTGDESINDDI